MTDKEILDILEPTGIKFKYFEWEKPPPLPFGVYLIPSSNNLFADNQVYLPIDRWKLELYTRRRDPGAEQKIKDVLNNAGICWQVTGRLYLDTEKMFMTIFEFEE